VSRLFDSTYARWWSRRGAARASRNPRYNELRQKSDPDGTGEVRISDQDGVSFDEWVEMNAIFDAINRRGPIWQFHWWLQRSGPRAIRRFWQRGRRGYSDDDLNNFGAWIALVIRDGVAGFRSRTNGYPQDLDEEEWDRRLAEIVDGYDAFLRWHQAGPGDDALRDNHLQEVYRRGADRFAEHLRNLWI
jgi:hypothetical protein